MATVSCGISESTAIKLTAPVDDPARPSIPGEMRKGGRKGTRGGVSGERAGGKQEGGMSMREIAASTGASTTTVYEYLTRAEGAGLSWPLTDGMDEDAPTRQAVPPPGRRTGRPAAGAGLARSAPRTEAQGARDLQPVVAGMEAAQPQWLGLQPPNANAGHSMHRFAPSGSSSPHGRSMTQTDVLPTVLCPDPFQANQSSVSPHLLRSGYSAGKRTPSSRAGLQKAMSEPGPISWIASAGPFGLRVVASIKIGGAQRRAGQHSKADIWRIHRRFRHGPGDE